jgi:hypothetical protein
MKAVCLPCLLVMGLFVTSAAGQTNDNPVYQGWATWRVGATATTKVISDGTPAITHIATLKSVDASAVVVENSTINEMDGMQFASPAAPHTYFAKISALPPAKTGTETLTVNGQKLECQWTELSGDAGAVTKTWMCKEVPGGMVQETVRADGVVATTQLVEWKGEKR